MTKKSLPYYAGAFWEIARIFFLFLVISLVVNPPGNPVTNLLLLWLCAGQMVGAVMFFLLGFDPEKFHALRRITAVFKTIGLLPGLFLAVLGFLLPGKASFGWAAPAVVTAVDFLFLVFLLSYSGGKSGHPVFIEE